MSSSATPPTRCCNRSRTRSKRSIARVVEASPVDEIFEQVDRVFALINDALSVPQNLVATLQRINTLLGHLADSGQQVDQLA